MCEMNSIQKAEEYKTERHDQICEKIYKACKNIIHDIRSIDGSDMIKKHGKVSRDKESLGRSRSLEIQPSRQKQSVVRSLTFSDLSSQSDTNTDRDTDGSYKPSVPEKNGSKGEKSKAEIESESIEDKNVGYQNEMIHYEGMDDSHPLYTILEENNDNLSVYRQKTNKIEESDQNNSETRKSESYEDAGDMEASESVFFISGTLGKPLVNRCLFSDGKCKRRSTLRKSVSTGNVNWECRSPFVFTPGRSRSCSELHAKPEELEPKEGIASLDKNKRDQELFNGAISKLHSQRRTTAPVINQIVLKNARQERKHRGSLPAHVADISQGNNRSPAKRRRDHFLKRRSNSASAISNATSSIPTNLGRMEEHDEELADHPEGHHSDRNSGQKPLTNGCVHGQEQLNQKSRYEKSRHSQSLGNMSSYKMFDIVGDRFDARFPWQRDVSVQCNLYTDSFSLISQSENVDIPNGVNDTKESNGTLSPTSELEFLRNRNTRPHSIGGVESVVQEEEFERLGIEQSQMTRKSDSFLHLSPRNQRKRPSFTMTEDHSSTSDLGSISENPDFERANSIVEDGEFSNMCSELRRLAVNSDRPPSIDVLPSPRVSPVMFSMENGQPSESDSEEPTESHSRRYLSVPRKTSRRKSSLSLTSASTEESDHEPSPPISRRGRRAAIVDTKNFGDVSPTNLSPEVSPCNSCDEGEGASNIAERLRRRRSSIDLAMNVYPGDLLVQERHKKLIKRNTISDFYSPKNGATGISDEHKKSRQSFSLRKLMKTRSKESLPRFEDALTLLKPSEFKDNHLSAYKNLHWSDLIASSDKQPDSLVLPETERKRREAVWELFKSECVFLIDHLMVLKHCFMEPLKRIQVEGFLMFAEPQDLFGNLDELCYVSYTFCKDFIGALLKGMSSTDFGSTDVLIRAFERFTTHSRDGGVYQTYCLNYVNALAYLDQLKRHDDFVEFEKFCSQDQRCNRLQLTDLLVAPMQHCTKFPLLLNNIRKYTEDPVEQQLLSELTDKVGISLQKMEDKMKWVKNYERLQEIQGQLVWPGIADLDPRAFVPEFLKAGLTKQPCERLLASPKRQLLHEGYVTLMESTKAIDIYIFLFDDILLLTKPKKIQRKKHSLDSNYMLLHSGPQPDKQSYTVYRQPMALDRLSLHDVNQSDATANGLKNAYVLVHISRYQQIIGVYTIQCPNETTKGTWYDKISEAKQKFKTSEISRQNSLSDTQAAGNGLPQENILRGQRRPGGLKGSHGKSLSMDAVYL